MTWLHRVLGKDGVTQLAVEAETNAARVTQRPLAVGARGSYGISLTTGVMAAGIAANSEIWQFRWSHATLLCLLRSVRVEMFGNTTAFTAGVGSVMLRIARSWTVQGTGGTGITFGSSDSKRKSSFAQSAMAAGDLRIATTAALGAGTKTLDGTDFAGLGFGVPATAEPVLITPGTFIWQRDTPDEWPIILAQNEGPVLRVTVPATGTWGLNVDVEWTEIDPAVYDGWT
jgi:hypothetical protein